MVTSGFLCHDSSASVSQVFIMASLTSWSSKFTSVQGRLDIARIYKAASSSGQSSRIYIFVWKSRAPPRVRFFGWLLLKDRIQSHANLYRKNIVDDATSELCHQAPETSHHLIFHCNIARQFWDHLGWHG
jgi:hypothetical protein